MLTSRGIWPRVLPWNKICTPRKTVLIACLLTFVFGHSQTMVKSRNFPTSRKNVPIAIINNSEDHFFVLRYNKEVHDLIIERRKKPGSEIVTISPLRMDSINANWFDYENLSYLFFEDQDRVFYVFEKVLNTERTLYLKSVDSRGKMSHFVPIHRLVKSKGMTDISFEFVLTQEKNIMVISTATFWNGSVEKQVILYDPFNLQIRWQKNLPPEDQLTGYSQGFQCNAAGDLFYYLVHASIVSQKRVYMNNQQVLMPVFYYNKIEVKSYFRNGEIYAYNLPLHDVWGLYGASLFPLGDNVGVHLHYQSNNLDGKPRVYLYNAMVTMLLDTLRYQVVSPLNNKVDSMLTYYDGTDEKEAATKEFNLKTTYVIGNKRLFFAERHDENYNKEVFFYEVDLTNGRVGKQMILPRKVFSFDGRNRFRNLGEFATGSCESMNYFFVMENKQNVQVNQNTYRHNDFRKQQGLGGVLAEYFFDDASIKKQYFTPDQDFDFVPLTYTGRPCQYIIYLNKILFEKFIILNLEKP